VADSPFRKPDPPPPDRSDLGTFPSNPLRFSGEQRSKKCRRGDLNPRPQDLSRGACARPAMSPVLYRAEPLRQGTGAPRGVLPAYGPVMSPPAATSTAGAGGDGASTGVAGSGMGGRSSEMMPRTSDRRISIFLSG
jgi:hypothetical protein